MIADQDFTTLQDFVGGRLSDDECRKFEERLVREPALVRQLEQSLRMREGFQHLRARGYIRTSSPVSWSFGTWTPAAFAAAAIAALGLFIWLPRSAGPASVLMSSIERPAGSDAASRVAAHFTFISVRGGTVPDLDLPAAGLIEIRAAPGSHPMVERYRVTLLRWDDEGSTKTIASLTGLTIDSDSYLHCYADAAGLTAGSYLLRVQPENGASDSANVFAFNLNTGRSGSSR